MQTESRILNDLGKLATGAAGVFQSLREEVETMARQRLERAVADLDVVTRDEFEAVKEMAANARMEAERLAAENAGLAERRDQSDHVANGVEDSGNVRGRAALHETAHVRRDRVKASLRQRRNLVAPGIGQIRPAVAEQHKRSFSLLVQEKLNAVDGKNA